MHTMSLKRGREERTRQSRLAQVSVAHDRETLSCTTRNRPGRRGMVYANE